MFNIFKKLKLSIQNTSKKFKKIFTKSKIKKNFLKNLEKTLLCSNVNIETTNFLIKKIKKKIINKDILTNKEANKELKKILIKLLKPIEKKLSLNKKKPLIIIIIGINGVGKTTTIGKLTNYILNNKQTVLLASCDTFRAGAYEQLKFWGDLNKVKTLYQKKSKPFSIALNATQIAKSKKIDNVIIDTAGRLTNKKHLMEELKKIKKTIINKTNITSYEILLIIDINNGQNILSQIKKFNKKLKITGLIITKLDGTSKGGIIISIAKKFKIPIYFLTTGEKINDIQKFKTINFINALF